MGELLQANAKLIKIMAGKAGRTIWVVVMYAKDILMPRKSSLTILQAGGAGYAKDLLP
jgi:hypothetical protein